jgi:hypothetical protein
LRKTFAALDRYWFGHGSPTTIGILRMLVGTLAFANLLMIAVDFDAWFSERGFVPQSVAQRWLPPVDPNFLLFGQEMSLPFAVPRLNFLAGVTDDYLSIAFYALVTMAALFTALGLFSRVATIVLAIGIVTLHHRNPIILHGGDSVLRIAVLYMALAPSGAACSLDRLIGLWRGRIEPGPVLVPIWTQRLVTYNLALIYLTTAWHKWFGTQWRDGTATWYTARLNEFERFPYPPFLREFPFVYFGTYSTLAIEFALGTLVFYRPLRKWVLLAGLGMHAFIEYTMNIPLFAFLICSLYVAFYDGSEVSGWARRVGERLRRFRLQVALPQGRRLREGPAAVLSAVDPFGLVGYEAGSQPAFTAKDARERPVRPYWASLTRSLGAWPAAAVPGLWRRLLSSATENMLASDDEKTKRREKAVPGG